MCEHLIGFDREFEIRILDRIAPFLCDLRLKLPMEGRIDLACIEVAGKVCQLRSRATYIALQGVRVDYAFPVRVRVAGCPDKQLRTGSVKTRN